MRRQAVGLLLFCTEQLLPVFEWCLRKDTNLLHSFTSSYRKPPPLKNQITLRSVTLVSVSFLKVWIFFTTYFLIWVSGYGRFVNMYHSVTWFYADLNWVTVLKEKDAIFYLNLVWIFNFWDGFSAKLFLPSWTYFFFLNICFLTSGNISKCKYMLSVLC